MSVSDKTRKNFYLPNELLVKLTKLAKQRGSTQTDILKAALWEYVNRELRND